MLSLFKVTFRLFSSLLGIFIVFNSYAVSASRGDQLGIFQACVADFTHDHCDVSGVNLARGRSLPFYLRLTGWTCASDADYQCQRVVTQYLASTGAPIEQFHGKWPFIRMLGVQEPASVLFSIMNGYVHLHGLAKIKQQVSIHNPMRIFYVVFAYIGMNAWLWSTVFHIRDFPSTEKMDYFSAGTYVLFGLFYAPVRVFKLYSYERYGQIVRGWAALCFGALTLHIGYLTFITFDYGYNMIANVVVGSLHGMLWILYTLIYSRDRPRWAYWPVFIVAALAAAMSLELCDFAPWMYILDAHSLWHLATVPVTWFWYKFLIRDAVWEQHHASTNTKRAS